MSNSIDTILELLTSDSQKANELKSFLGSFAENNNSQADVTAITDTKLQHKINLIHAMIPLLNTKGTEYAQFVIKLLSLISVLQKLKNSQN